MFIQILSGSCPPKFKYTGPCVFKTRGYYGCYCQTHNELYFHRNVNHPLIVPRPRFRHKLPRQSIKTIDFDLIRRNRIQSIMNRQRDRRYLFYQKKRYQLLTN